MPPDLRGRRIVVAEGQLFDDLDPDVASAFYAAMDVFRDLGADVESRELPVLGEAGRLAERCRIVSGEAWRNHAATLRAWGKDRDWLTDWILDGEKVSDAELEAAHALQRRFQDRFAGDLEGVDALALPSTQITARPIPMVEDEHDPHNFACLRNTKAGNFLNLCGLSMPCGLDSEGRPIGLQLCAPAFADDKLLAIGMAWQKATPHHKRRPTLEE